MANNCDYCHKPLSLMRRLRGEQFCSTEHMDLYATQQAEFALERLAASVTDRPSTERPPAIPRPIPRSRTTPAEEVVPTVPSQPEPHTAVALQDKDLHTPETAPSQAEPELVRGSADAEFPLAAYLAQHPVEARTWMPSSHRKSGFDPVEHWGKVSPGWSMPPFHSEPGDPRTWNAGKLVSQVPPVAGWRELLAPKAAGPLESTSDVSAQFPTLPVTVDQITALAAQTELRSVFPERLNERKTLQLQRGPQQEALQTTSAAEVVWLGPSLTSAADAVRGAFRVAEGRLESSAPSGTGLRPQNLVVEWQDIGSPEWTPSAAVPGGFVIAETVIQGLQKAVTQPVSWHRRARIAPAAEAGNELVGPALPEGACILPDPESWTWAQSFQVPGVALPELRPSPWAHTAGTEVEWQELPGTLRNPALLGISPHLGYSGPNFGWESTLGRTGNPLERMAHEPANDAEIDPRIQEFRARVHAGLDAPGRFVLLGWSTLKLDTAKLEVGPLVNLRPTVTSMAIQVRPLMPFRTAHLEAVRGAASTLVPVAGLAPVLITKRAMLNVPAPAEGQRLQIPGPVPVLRSAQTTVRLPIALAQTGEKISQNGPIKYSPVAIVVVPPPQFALLPPVLTDEQRYVAQSPNGVWRLPRVRHTGYRALGPFPKMPLRLPDRYLRTNQSEVPPPFQEIPLRRIDVREDPSVMPSFGAPTATHVHPADYFAWPKPKGLKFARLFPERLGTAPKSAQSAPRRFGPGRAGLQSRDRSADGLARGRT